LYNKIFADATEMEHFLNKVCTSDWNEEQDAGRSLAEATEILVKEFPEHEENIRAYYGRWDEMLGGVFEETVETLRKMKESKRFKLYGLTNWSAETFPIAQSRYEFLHWFDGVVVSGTERLRKPFPEFYKILLDRYNVKADEALFIDDNIRNVKAAEELGIQTIHFKDPAQMNEALKEKGIVL
jgi:2-haloacid dehalogenase